MDRAISAAVAALSLAGGSCTTDGPRDAATGPAVRATDDAGSSAYPAYAGRSGDVENTGRGLGQGIRSNAGNSGVQSRNNLPYGSTSGN
jgi:hypothetical protein